MFTSKVVKPQTKAAATNKLAPQRSVFATRPFDGEAVEQAGARSLTGNEPHGHSEQETDPPHMTARGTTPRVSCDFSKVRPNGRRALLPLTAPLPLGLLQPKLVVGAVDDPLEHEADRITDQVMRMSDPAIATTPPQINRKCTACEEEEKNTLQTKSAATAKPVGGAPPIVHEVLRSSGQPLGATTRAYMEPRFRHDFSKVRVHTDEHAAESARAMGALAYAVGQHIAFDSGQYAPSSVSGRRLLAHELTHVVQQSSAGGAPVSVQRYDEGEHKGIGDTASGGQTIFLAPDMPVTYGEVVALAGDYFADWPTLHRLANHPGITEGTRGELWYAILVKIRPSLEASDPKKAEKDGLDKVFDKKAKEAVEARHITLSASNVAHFPNPRKGDAARSQGEKDDLGSGAIGAGATYRSNHLTALTMAAAIGQQSRSPHGSAKRLNDALFVEAFGDHFLTDAFAGGHQQTERSSIQEYWNAKVPAFWSNVQQWMAQAIVMQLRTTSKMVAAVTPQYARNDALEKVQNATAKLPQLGFGDLVSGAIHDYFNLHGAEAEVAGHKVTLVGDSELLKHGSEGPGRHVADRSRDTFNAATAAVKAGVDEVRQAYALGYQGEDPQMVPEKIFRAGGGLFAAEKLLPHLLPDDQVASPLHKSIDWEVASYKDLLSQPRFAEGLTLSLIKYADQVASNLSGLEPEQMAAVDVAVSQRMKTGDPLRLTEEIINYVPISGGGIEPRLLNDLGAVRNDLMRPR